MNLRDLNKNTPIVRIWMEGCMQRDIRALPLLDASWLYERFRYLCDVCDDTGMDFWGLVDGIGGFHAVRALIHAILAVRAPR